MENWDTCNDSYCNVSGQYESQEPAKNETVGRTFGSRGRGFSPALKKSEPRVGGTLRALDDDWCNNKENDGRASNVEGSGGSWGCNVGETKGKPRSTYIPEAPTEDESEIFGNGISSGINFSKYDDIEVNVSGENPPGAINSFGEAGLHSLLSGLIRKCNYHKPTPIQKFSIPIIMSGRDMMACAQTGSGKTAAFLIPIINRLLEDKVDVKISRACRPQVVVISPTRELAIQIFNEARKFSHGSDLKIAISYGGTSVFHQIQNIMKGCNILVATPGRLIDFVRKGKVEFSEIKFFVLDEADRMLDLGFLSDMETLLTHHTMVPDVERQTLMFSATFPEEIQRLAGKFLRDYLFVAVGIVGGACADVEQRFFSVTKYEKRNKLVELLTEMGSAKCLVFVEQKRTTDFIATFLCEKNFPATSIHGDREQREREEALGDFKKGRMDVLVATSVAARGLDIKNVAHVVNFDLPKTVDEYVHRIGRTGRVGNRGLATSFFDPEQDRPIASDLCKILEQARQPVPDFLRRESLGRGSYDGSAKFGGCDVRPMRLRKSSDEYIRGRSLVNPILQMREDSENELPAQAGPRGLSKARSLGSITPKTKSLSTQINQISKSRLKGKSGNTTPKGAQCSAEMGDAS